MLFNTAYIDGPTNNMLLGDRTQMCLKLLCEASFYNILKINQMILRDR